MSNIISKDDRMMHSAAFAALSHYYKFGDSGKLLRVILQAPMSNRRTALLKWVNCYSNLSLLNECLIKNKSKPLDESNLSRAQANPFWTFKIKQLHRRHVSGNFFDPDMFFNQFLAEINENIDKISKYRIECTIRDLTEIASKKSKAITWHQL